MGNEFVMDGYEATKQIICNGRYECTYFEAGKYEGIV